MQAIGEEEEEDEEDEEEEEEEEEAHKVGGKRKRSKPQQFDASSLEAVEKSLKMEKQKAKPSAAQQFKPPASSSPQARGSVAPPCGENSVAKRLSAKLAKVPVKGRK